jgi:threonine/homoserine/homoserine lactone efflux protein
MMPTDSFIAVYVFSFSMAIGAVLSPGPVTTAIISQTPRLGWVTGPLVSVGHAVLEGLMVLLVVFGLSGILGAPSVQTGIALLGGLLLFWMAGEMLINVFRGRMRLPEAHEAEEKSSYGRMVSLGIIASLSNPFWYAWWMTAAAVFLLQSKEAGWMITAGFYFGHISADFLWNTMLSTVIGSGRKWFNNRLYAILISLCSAFLVYLAFQFLITGINGLTG